MRLRRIFFRLRPFFPIIFFLFHFIEAALGYIGDRYQIEFKCNGVIVSEYFILTAAHCVDLDYRPVVVRLNTVSTNNSQLFEFQIQVKCMKRSHSYRLKTGPSFCLCFTGVHTASILFR